MDQKNQPKNMKLKETLATLRKGEPITFDFSQMGREGIKSRRNSVLVVARRMELKVATRIINDTQLWVCLI